MSEVLEGMAEKNYLVKKKKTTERMMFKTNRCIE